MSLAPRALTTLTSGLLAGVAFFAVTPAVPASAGSTTLCSGWGGCVAAGYSDAGYGAVSRTSYWNMFGGHNCTNYVAYRMIQAGMSSTRPFSGTGNAWNWGTQLAAQTDQSPAVGAVAWWNKGVRSAGSVGHVAVVEQVVSPTEVVVSEDSWNGTFHWRRITTGSGWPSGFIHMAGPVAVPAVTNTAPVSIAGTPAMGQTLTANPGSWSPAATIGYQWFVDGAPLSGATGSTLKLSSAQAGKAVTVRVTAAASGYTTASADAAPIAVPLAPLSPAGPPPVDGVAKNPVVGTTLTAKDVSFSPVARRTSVQWFADGVPISGATGWTYQLGGADVAKTVTAVVTGKRPGYGATPASSQGIGPVVAGRIKVEKPFAISGRPLVGRTLKVTDGVVSPVDATATFVWRRDGKIVDGASGPTYTLTPADAGSQMSVSMSIAHAGWLTRKTSAERGQSVASTPTIKLKTSGKKGRATVWFKIDAPGVAKPTGRATVTVGSITRQVTVRKGVGRLILKGLAAGARAVEVRWLGSASVTTGAVEGTVKVRKS